MIDGLVANAGRLRILTALAGAGAQEFVSLRRATQLTDGNLATHAKRLQHAGLIAVDKQFRAGKPVTSFVLTAHGRTALESHVATLVRAINPSVGAAAPSSSTSPIGAVEVGPAQDDWVD